MTTILSVQDITVIFGGLTAVDGVSFDVEDGQLLGLIGPNGAGKTTAMRVITGIVKPNSGEIELAGQRVTQLPIHKRVHHGLGLSQQLVRPFREMTVLENVAFAAGYRKTRDPLKSLTIIRRDTERKRAAELLDIVGIADRADADPDSMPLGVLKRLEVARALALDPKILLLDEPLAGLNSAEAGTLADTIRDLNKSGLSIVLIEHNLGEVMRVCARLVVLDNGRKIGDGPAQEVMNDPVVRGAYLGVAEGDANAAA
jgi:branched-chain amino acid transport system ATP-binding protein